MLNKGHNIDIEQDSKELRKQAEDWRVKKERGGEIGKEREGEDLSS